MCLDHVGHYVTAGVTIQTEAAKQGLFRPQSGHLTTVCGLAFSKAEKTQSWV